MRHTIARRIGLGLSGLAACGGEQTGPTNQPSTDRPNEPETALSVQLSTLGIAPGVPTFPVAVDGVDRAVPPNGILRFAVAEGTHRVELHNIPRFCQIQVTGSVSSVAWTSAREVAVSGGQTVTVPFAVTCFETGTLRIETHTNADAQYHLLIGSLSNDPRWLFELPPTGVVLLPYVAVGRHRVQVSLPPGCTGDGSQVAEIAANAVDTLRFEHACP